MAKIELQYTKLCQHTIGIVFYGTPHRGTSAATYGNILAKAASTIRNQPSSQLLCTLQNNSPILLELTVNFMFQLPRYQIVSFFEAKPLRVGAFNVLVRIRETCFHLFFTHKNYLTLFRLLKEFSIARCPWRGSTTSQFKSCGYVQVSGPHRH